MALLMEESTTDQAILEEGRTRGLTQGIVSILIEQGPMRFGAPPAPVLAALQNATVTTRLRDLAKRILTASSWDDLLEKE